MKTKRKNGLFGVISIVGLLIPAVGAAGLAVSGFLTSPASAATVRQDDDPFGFDIDFDFDFTFGDEAFEEEKLPLEKPDIENAVQFDEWNDRFHSVLVRRIINRKEVDVETLVSRLAGITESDGALYHYVTGYVYDQLMRRTFADDRAAETLDAHHAAAVEHYDKAIEMNGGNAVFQHFRGQADFFYADLKREPEYFVKAMPFYAQAAELAPEWERPLASLGWCAFRLARYREAIAFFEEAEKRDAESDDVSNGLSQARQKLEKVAAFLDPDVGPDMTCTSTARRIMPPQTTESQALDRWNDAFRDIVVALPVASPDKVPELVAQLTGLVEADGMFYHYVCGYVCDRFARNFETFREENGDKAVEYFDAAIAFDDGVAVFYHFRGQVDYQRGMNSGDRKFFEKALENYRAAAQCDPKWDMPVNMRGWACFQSGDYEEALVAFAQAVVLNDQCIDAMKGYVETCLFLSDNDTGRVTATMLQNALDDITRWNELVRDDVEKRMTHGVFYHHQGAERLVARLKYSFGRVDELTHPEYYSRFALAQAMRMACDCDQYDRAAKLSAIIESEEHRNVLSDLFDSAEHFLRTSREYYFIRAQCRHGIGEYEKALDDLATFERRLGDAARLDEPYVSRVLRYRLSSLFQLGRYDDVIALYAKDEGRSLGYADETFVAVGLAFHRLGKHREMLECFAGNRSVSNLIGKTSRRMQNREEFEEFRGVYIDAFMKNADSVDETRVREFVEQISTLIYNSPECHAVLQQAAELCVGIDDLDRAGRLYSQYLDFEPQDMAATEKLLQLLERRERWHEAVPVASKLIAMDPENPTRWIARARLEGKDTSNSRPRLSISDLTRAMKLLDGEKSHRMARLHFWRGEQFAKAYRFDEAVDDWKAAMEMTSGTQKIESIDGKMSLMPLELVLSVYRIIDPDTDEDRSEFFPEMIDFCTQAIEKGHDERMVLATRAQIFERAGQYREAVDDYMVLVTFGLPEGDMLTMGQCCYNISRCYELGSFPDLGRRERWEKAVEFATRAIEHADEPDAGLFAHRHSLYRQLYDGEQDAERRKMYRERMTQDRKKAGELGYQWSY